MISSPWRWPSTYKSTAELVAHDHPAWQTFPAAAEPPPARAGPGRQRGVAGGGTSGGGVLSQAKSLDESLDDLAAAFDKIMEDRPIRELPITYEE